MFQKKKEAQHKYSFNGNVMSGLVFVFTHMGSFHSRCWFIVCEFQLLSELCEELFLQDVC